MADIVPEFIKQGKVLLVDKPLHWTSFDVVNKIRYAVSKAHRVRKPKVGHAGTLDPLATGLMLICVGAATKQAQQLTGLDKCYSGVITLGGITPSYDLETEVEQSKPFDHITFAQLNEAANSFKGTFHQMPPMFSAKKVGGKKAYEVARKGGEIALSTKEITISRFEIATNQLPEVQFEVCCSSGTYIRSLAHDFGQYLECGAYLSELRRTQIGQFKLKDALQIDEVLEQLPSWV